MDLLAVVCSFIMKKVEKRFILDNETYTLMYEKKSVKCYFNDDNDSAVITNDNDEVLFMITAECAQNSGFINYIDGSSL